ncbi:MAG TPA: GAF domain-containing SpoIIE family protein phosphatase [Vicinamibacterales bacterium]|nr:GAF domain-containing SpoIIE family protein phosphatase [Vicinamibacterales bacterium]
MNRVGLKQVIGRSAETRELVDALAVALGATVSVEDSEGRLLHGRRSEHEVVRFPVTLGESSLGWVSGPPHAGPVARVLDHLVAREAEKKALGAEVLHLYREINLIYSFSEKLAALLQVERVAALTLQEARHMIVATDGVIMLLDEETGELTSVAGFGDEIPSLQGFRRGRGIIGAIAATGNGEIVNEVDADPRRITEQNTVKALIAAPLKVGERVTGVIALGSTLPMPYTAAELKLLSTLALQTATALENARLFERTVQAAQERERLMALHQQAEIARAKLESEMTLAARIQSALFPSELPNLAGYDIAARNRPARQCGGDYYDVIRFGDESGDGRILLCVADVSGKGLPASLVMSNMQATLRALLGREPSLPALAERASELLYGSTAPEKYVTAALVDLDPKTGTFRLVSAGHTDTLLIRASGEVVSLTSTGTPLGLMPPGMRFGERESDLRPGDTLLLFSDGVPEAQDCSDNEFGEARLIECVRLRAGLGSAALIDHVLDSIDAFVGGAPQFDDITLLVVRRS